MKLIASISPSRMQTGWAVTTEPLDAVAAPQPAVEPKRPVQSEHARMEAIIQEGLEKFVRVGAALRWIRDHGS